MTGTTSHVLPGFFPQSPFWPCFSGQQRRLPLTAAGEGDGKFPNTILNVVHWETPHNPMPRPVCKTKYPDRRRKVKSDKAAVEE